MRRRVRERSWHIDEVGSGDPPVVLLPELGFSAQSLADLRDSLAGRHRVLSIDLPGFGATGLGRELAVDAVAADLAAVLFRVGAYEPVLVGHGLGGAVALQTASLVAGPPAAVALIAPAPVVPDEATALWLRQLARDLAGDDAATARARLAARWLTAGDLHGPAVRHALAAAPGEVLARYLDELVAWDGEAAARACACPVLVVEGGDPLQPSDALAPLVPRLETARFPGVGHFVYLERPEEVAASIAGFVRRARAAAGAAPAGALPPGALIPALVDDLVAGGASLVVATRDRERATHIARAVGVIASASRRAVTVYLPTATAAAVLADVGDNGALAVVLSRPSDSRTLQLKGRVTQVRDAAPGEREPIERWREAFADQLDQIGVAATVAARLACWPAVALSVEVDSVFDQSPGPGAGAEVTP